MDEQPGKRRGPLLWLAGRLRRESRSRLVWVEVGLVVLYFLSYWPADWICRQVDLKPEDQVIFNLIYWPVRWVHELIHHIRSEAFRWWVETFD